MNFSGVLHFIQLKAIQPILDWFYPSSCLICELPNVENNQIVCKECWKNIPKALNSSLESLWLVREEKEKLYFDGFYSCFLFDDSIQKIIHQLKYEKMTRLAKEIIRNAIPDLINEQNITSCDWIIPIPLHKKRQKRRGYNQSFLLAKALSNYLNINTLVNVLVRNRNTQSQTLLKAEDRQKNVSDAFEVFNSKLINNSSILLLDDLITTGATANECARVLKEKNVKKIFVLAIARPL